MWESPEYQNQITLIKKNIEKHEENVFEKNNTCIQTACL